MPAASSPATGGADPVHQLLDVASVVLAHGGIEEQAIVGSSTTTSRTAAPTIIDKLLGEPVLDIVLACTNTRVPVGTPKLDWWTRKAAYLH